MQVGVRWAGLECIAVQLKTVEDGAVTETARFYTLRCACGTTIEMREDEFPGKQFVQYCGRDECTWRYPKYRRDMRVELGEQWKRSESELVGNSKAKNYRRARLKSLLLVAERIVSEAKAGTVGEAELAGAEEIVGEIREEMEQKGVRGRGRPRTTPFGRKFTRSVVLSEGVWDWARSEGMGRGLSAAQMAARIVEERYMEWLRKQREERKERGKD